MESETGLIFLVEDGGLGALLQINGWDAYKLEISTQKGIHHEFKSETKNCDHCKTTFD